MSHINQIINEAIETFYSFNFPSVTLQKSAPDQLSHHVFSQNKSWHQFMLNCFHYKAYSKSLNWTWHRMTCWLLIALSHVAPKKHRPVQCVKPLTTAVQSNILLLFVWTHNLHSGLQNLIWSWVSSFWGDEQSSARMCIIFCQFVLAADNTGSTDAEIGPLGSTTENIFFPQKFFLTALII